VYPQSVDPVELLCDWPSLDRLLLCGLGLLSGVGLLEVGLLSTLACFGGDSLFTLGFRLTLGGSSRGALDPLREFFQSVGRAP